MKTNTIHIGDSRMLASQIEPNSIHCCVTSPPYFGLRNYGHPDQIGLETTVEDYVGELAWALRLTHTEPHGRSKKKNRIVRWAVHGPRETTASVLSTRSCRELGLRQDYDGHTHHYHLMIEHRAQVTSSCQAD